MNTFRFNGTSPSCNTDVVRTNASGGVMSHRSYVHSDVTFVVSAEKS